MQRKIRFVAGQNKGGHSMRSIASFASLLALGLLVGAVLMMATSGSGESGALANGVDGTGGVDFRSLLIGLVLGLMLSNLSRVPWADFPRRVVAWVLSYEHNFFYFGIATVLIIILIFY